MTDAPFKTYTCSYPFKGSHWGLDIKAVDRAEAEARLKALAWAKVDGEVAMVFPAAEMSVVLKPAEPVLDPIERGFLALARGLFGTLNGYVRFRNWAVRP